MKINKKGFKRTNPDEVSKEEFANLIESSIENEDEDEDRKKKIRFFADKIAEKFEEYKKKAVELLENAEELDRFLERVDEKLKKLGTAGKKLAYVPEMIMLVRSYVIKEYTDISLAEIIAIIAALIYFVSLLDVFPDIVPGLGILDDVVVVSIVVAWCDEDIDKYMKWRAAR